MVAFLLLFRIGCFNSRSREGSDAHMPKQYRDGDHTFQFALPRGERRR